MKVVIMAGGKGTRISSINSDIPKPMISIEGKPVLEREIISLANQGFKDIIITVSHLGHIIMDYFGDGRKFGVKIKYYNEIVPLGNAGALFKLKDELTEDFLLLNADTMFNVDFNRFVDFHHKHNGLATILTHPNSHPYDSGLVISDNNHKVVKWLSKEDHRPEWYKNRVNAGIHILSPKLLETVPNYDMIDLDKHLLKPLADKGELYCYDSPEYIKDMGTPERYYTVCRDCRCGIIDLKCLLNKQRAIFLDRDGTINKYVGFLRNIKDFELLPETAEAIRRINESGYLAIVVTNQPVIARGEVSFSEIEQIHNKMETLLGNEGVYLDAIYFCPHHPHRGYEGEVKELKVECTCRKPKPGMLVQAADDYNISLNGSWMVGDDENDILAGKAAGCRTMRIQKDYSLLDAVKDILGE